jgi:LemA protein
MNIMILLFVGVVLCGLTAMAVNIYNGLISLRNQLERAWSNIDVVLKQRFDEIPQLIQVIEQYAGYESELLKNLADSRTRYGMARNVPEKIEASREMSLALQGVIAIGEAYPELKSNQNFVQLQTRISALENMISDRREAYNETVANFNTRIDQFPDVLAARILNYQRQEMFQATEAERTAPSLKMNLPKFGKGA